MVFWHPKGWTLFQRSISLHARKHQRGRLPGGQRAAAARPEPVGEVRPLGEVPREHVHHARRPDERVYAIKPMNCPGHVQIFKQGLRSYRDLPLRYAEFGKVPPLRAVRRAARAHAGARLHPGRRHIFCTEDQITAECGEVQSRADPQHLRDFGFDDVRIKFSDRPRQARRLDAVWDKAERAARAARGGRHRVHAEPGRGRLLRPETRIRAARRHRPRLAMRHPAGRLQPAGRLGATTSTRTARSTRR
jgi:threonyl-tRNA synthetase